MPFDEQDAARIWREITGFAPVLRPASGQREASRPTLGVAETYSGVTGREAWEPGELETRMFRAISRFDKIKLLAIISNVNAQLLAASDATVHRRLEADLLRPDL